MLDTVLLLPEGRREEAIALDGLRVVFQTLEEASIRLEDKLIAIEKNSQPMIFGSIVFYEYQVNYSSIMVDIWVLIDNIFRVSLFLKFIPVVNSEEVGQEYNREKENIKALRDSLHHINERITRYFTEFGDSISGDIIWRSRDVIGEREISHFLFSGVHHGDMVVKIGEVQPERFLNNIGVYDLRMQYVKRRNAQSVEEYIEVNIHDAIEAVNKVIIKINDTYTSFLVTQEGKTITSIPPGLTGARIGD